MAVTSVTITSGPTVVGRSVTISGTLSRDGGGTNNRLNFYAYNRAYTTGQGLINGATGTQFLDVAGSAGSGITWSYTGAMPEGDWRNVVIDNPDPPYGVWTSSASEIGIIKLTPGLPGIWTPRRDARGLFVPRNGRSTSLYATGGQAMYGAGYFYPTPDGIYRSVVDAVGKAGAYGGTAKAVPTQFGLGIDVPNNWEWSGPAPSSLGMGTGGTHLIVSLFSLHNASQYVSGIYPAVLGESRSSLNNDSDIYGYWQNPNGEQSVLVRPSTGFGGTEFSINGLGNGLHCLVLISTFGSGASGLRAFLNGNLVATSSAPVYAGLMYLRPYYFFGSISQSHLNVGNVLLNAGAINVSMSDAQAAALSLDPYRYFFIDAPSQKSKLTSRFISLPTGAFQYSRPTTDLLTGWTRVPASGTHVSAINEVTSNQSDYLQATSPTLVDSFTMDQLQQPATGGLDINYDIDASVRSTKIELLNGASVVKSVVVAGSSLSVGRFLPQRWRKQPSYPALIDESSRFSDEIVHAGTPYHRGQNASSRYPVSFAGGTDSLPYVGGRGGLAWKSVQYFEWTASSHPWAGLQSGVQFPQTLMVVMSAEADSFAGTALYSGPSWGMGGGDRISVNTSGQLNYFQSYVEVLVASTPIPTRAVNVLMLTSAPSIGTRLFINGRLAASDATYRPGSAGTYAPPERIGFTQNTGSYPWYTFASVAWKRALSDADAAALGENPWQIFRPATPKFFSLPGATTTGTINVSSAELAGVSWPWTPTVRLTSQ